ncbi:hypothetical protein OH492_10315 [Vibrio chagasii]|nr:hypothetical protein [Vibrio chagasii]
MNRAGMRVRFLLENGAAAFIPWFSLLLIIKKESSATVI